MNPINNSVCKLKTEPKELEFQPLSKKVKREPKALSKKVKNENVEFKFQPLSKKGQHVKQEHGGGKEEQTKEHVKKEHVKEEHVKKHVTEEHLKQECKWQQPSGLINQEDTKVHDIKSKRIHDSLASNWLKNLPDLLWDNFFRRPDQIHSRWDALTEEEIFLREIWRVGVFKPSEEALNMQWGNLGDDTMRLIRVEAEMRTSFYKSTRRAVERKFRQEPKNGTLLFQFASYFHDSQEGVKVEFPDMTRQEVYDTCLLRYFAMSKRDREKYHHRGIYEDSKLYHHRFRLFQKDMLTTNGPHRLNHLSREEIEAYMKRIPRTMEVESLNEHVMVNQRETEKVQFIVLDIKPYSDETLANQISCRWKGLTPEKNFQYELTRAFGGVILVEDIDVVWKNLNSDMRSKNICQTGSKVGFIDNIKRKMEELNEDVLYSFSSYFCEFENIIKAEFPDMTEAEVYDTCLLRYIAAPKEFREVYEILSTREECKKLFYSRFVRTLS